MSRTRSTHLHPWIPFHNILRPSQLCYNLHKKWRPGKLIWVVTLNPAITQMFRPFFLSKNISRWWGSGDSKILVHPFLLSQHQTLPSSTFSTSFLSAVYLNAVIPRIFRNCFVDFPVKPCRELAVLLNIRSTVAILAWQRIEIGLQSQRNWCSWNKIGLDFEIPTVHMVVKRTSL